MSKRVYVLLFAIALWGCASAGEGGSPGTGGTSASGGAPGTGGEGGTTGIGSAAGGAPGTDGIGGSIGTGGGEGGSTGTGGAAGNGRATGGTTGTGGAGGGSSSLDFSYWLVSDVSFEETQPDATRANLLSILKSHGFNSIRLRTFVDPKAADGYDKSGGAADLAHTIAFGKQIKAAGMGFLVDFH